MAKMRLCPRCGGRFALKVQACPLDGTTLLVADPNDDDTERLGAREAQDAVARAAQVFSGAPDEDEDEATIIQQTPDLARSSALVESTVIQGSGGAMRAVKLDQPLASIDASKGHASSRASEGLAAGARSQPASERMAPDPAARPKLGESRTLTPEPRVGLPSAQLRLSSSVDELDEDLTKPLPGKLRPAPAKLEPSSAQVRALTTPTTAPTKLSPVWFVVIAFFVILLVLIALLVTR